MIDLVKQWAGACPLGAVTGANGRALLPVTGRNVPCKIVHIKNINMIKYNTKLCL